MNPGRSCVFPRHDTMLIELSGMRTICHLVKRSLNVSTYFFMYSKSQQRKSLQSNHASVHSSVQTSSMSNSFQKDFLELCESFLFFRTRRSPRGEKQFWEFHVTSTGTLLGVCSHSDLQNIWMKGMCFNPPLFVFG